VSDQETNAITISYYKEQIEKTIAAERERCAQIAEDHYMNAESDIVVNAIAAAIRRDE
jgi:hypothetical protein